MKRQSLPGTISPRPNRSTCSTVILASSAGLEGSPPLSHPFKLFPRSGQSRRNRISGLKNSADYGSCPREFGSPLSADENTNSEMFRGNSTRLWQRTFISIAFCRRCISDEIFLKFSLPREQRRNESRSDILLIERKREREISTYLYTQCVFIFSTPFHL